MAADTRGVRRVGRSQPRGVSRAVLAILALALGGCGATSAASTLPGSRGSESTVVAAVPQAHPHVVEPTAGAQAVASGEASDPVGDVNAHAPSLAQIRQELKLELIYAPVTNAAYINPLHFVSLWERTDQGVDAVMPVGAPILAPGTIKILAIEPNWYAGQPLVYWELLDGPDAGRVQFVAEEITDIAQPGSILQQGQVIARFAASGTGIEFGWSTTNGITLARATTGYEEGQVTPAGLSIRAWLNSLGANAGMR
jgi:hypothetical protein